MIASIASVLRSLGGAAFRAAFRSGSRRAARELTDDAAEAAGKTGTALVPRSTVELGKWGERRLAQVLKGRGFKPRTALKTSLGNRFPDRIVGWVAHEAKAGVNLKLTPAIEKQVLKDVDLLRKTRVDEVHWHFFQGAAKELLDFLTEHGIKYTVY